MPKLLTILLISTTTTFILPTQAQETAHSDLFLTHKETTTNTTTTNTETTEETYHLSPLPPPPKENISATFTTSPQVNYGSYQWTIELTTDTSDEITLDTTKVQIWNAFKITDYTKF